MNDVVNLKERPTSARIDMIMGWRQWADGGSVSSALPKYLYQETKARRIGTMRPDGFYLFQIPGTHDLVRPTIKFEDGYPRSLETPKNEFWYSGDDEHGFLFFLGDEPHMDIERYTQALLDVAEELKVQRIITLGGVYGELPYDKERLIGAIYSLPQMKDEIRQLAVNMSDYHGGASIGSYVCKRASERKMEMVGLYAFVPTYDFSSFTQRASSISLENDFTAWVGVVKRINYMLKTRLDTTELESKSEQLMRAIDAKIDELEGLSSDLGLREYMERLSDNFVEMTFSPLDDVWEEELRRLFDGGASSGSGGGSSSSGSGGDISPAETTSEDE